MDVSVEGTMDNTPHMTSQGAGQRPGNPLPEAPKGLVVECSLSYSSNREIYEDVHVLQASYSGDSVEVVDTGVEGEASWVSHRRMGGGVASNIGGNVFPVSWSCDTEAKEVAVHVQEGCVRRLRFDVAVFAQCGCLVDHRGNVVIALITADSYVHLVSFSGSLVDVSSQYIGSSQNGVPLSLELLNDVVCIGSACGSITCVPIKEGKLNANISNMGSQGGLLGNLVGSYFGSFFGGSARQVAGNGVACMDAVTVRMDEGEEKSLVCSLYMDATLRIWDVDSKHLLHEVALLPPHEAEHVAPSCLTHSRDALHDDGYFLVASFEKKEGESRSHLCLFEMTIQDRKHGVLNVHVDSGPRLTGVRGRVTSASLEYVGSGYHVWFISEDENGSKMQRISFEGEADGRHSGVTYAVQSAEERMRNLGGSSDLDREMLKMYFVAIGSLLTQGNLIDYILDDVFLPFNASKKALESSLQALGLDDGEEDVRSCITTWILNGSADESFSRCLGFLDVYIKEFEKHCCPLAIRVIQNDDVEQKTVVAVRGDEKMSCLFDAHPCESIGCRTTTTSEIDLVSEFYAVMNVFASSAAVSMSLYALRHGVNMRKELLPSLLKVVTGHVRIDAVEFGRKALPVRKVLRNFPVILNDWEQDVIGTVVDHILEESRVHAQRGDWIYRKIDEDVRFAAVMNSSLHACAVARLDLLIKLCVAVEYYSRRNSLVGTEIAAAKQLEAVFDECFQVLIAYWACMQRVCLQKQILPAELMADEEIMAEGPLSKRAKREISGNEYHMCDVMMNLIQDSSNPQDIGGLSMFRNALLNRVVQGNNNLPVVMMHSILREERILNQDEVVKSMIDLVDAAPAQPGIEIKIFKAFLQLKSCLAIRDASEKRLLEQEGLAALMSLYAFAEGSTKLAECLESVCSWIGVSAGSFGLLSQEGYLDLTGEILERLGCSSSFKYIALLSARLYESSESREGIEKSVRAWGKLFKTLEDEGHLEEAYIAALSVLDPQIQMDCIKSLVDHFSSTKALKSLCTLPLLELRGSGRINVFDQISHALWDKALKEPIDESKAYHVLYDFYVSRGNFQSAAAAVLSYCRRLVKESDHGSLEIVLSLQKMLTLAVGCLKMVEPRDAWLEDSNPLDQEVLTREFVSDMSVVRAEYAVPQVIDIKSVEREYALVKALVHIASLIPNYDIHKNEKEIFSQLLSLALYEEAWNLAENVFPCADFQQAREKIVFRLSEHATISGSPEDWRRLKSFIDDKGQSSVVQDRMRLAAVEAILASDPTMGIPPWILEPYLCQYDFLSSKSTPKHRMSDSTGMIRLLVQYGKLELAAQLALELLSPVTTAMPSISLPKVGSIHLPHDVLSQLLTLLERNSSTDSALKTLHSKISVALDSTNTSAVQQTETLENMLSI